MNVRAAQVRIYVGADMLGLGKILAGLRNDVTHPGDPGAVIHERHRASCPITSLDVLDSDWQPGRRCITRYEPGPPPAGVKPQVALSTIRWNL